MTKPKPKVKTKPVKTGPVHYLVLTFPFGKDEVRREYFPLVDEAETEAEAVDRWVAGRLAGRVRNREVAGRRLRDSILWTRVARPSSYWRAEAERLGQPYPTPVRRRKGAAV